MITNMNTDSGSFGIETKYQEILIKRNNTFCTGSLSVCLKKSRPPNHPKLANSENYCSIFIARKNSAFLDFSSQNVLRKPDISRCAFKNANS